MSIILSIVVFGVAVPIGIWWFSATILPLAYGLPKASLLALRGWVKPTAPLAMLAGPVIPNIICWAVGSALLRFAPDLLDHSGRAGFLGLVTGVLFGLGPALTRDGRNAIRTEFAERMDLFLTPKGVSAMTDHIATTDEEY